METTVQGFVQVHGSMEPVLPCIDDAEGHAHTKNRPAISVGKPEQRIWNPSRSPVVFEVPNLVKLVACGWRRIYTVNSVSHHQLNDMLNNNIIKHILQRRLIPQLLLLARMYTVLLSKLVHVDDMEKGGVSPVGNDRSKDGKDAIRKTRNKTQFGHHHDRRRQKSIRHSSRNVGRGQ